MDVSTAFELMARDMAELGSWFPVGTSVVVMALALPIASVVMVRRGHRTAWLAVAGACVILGEWFLYYATDWWPNTGQGTWVAIAAVAVVSWAILAAALLSGGATEGG